MEKTASFSPFFFVRSIIICNFAKSNSKRKAINMESMQSQTIQLTLPKSDIKMLKKLASGMGWVVSAISSRKKSGIEKGLEDIRKGNVYHAKNSQDLINQILG